MATNSEESVETIFTAQAIGVMLGLNLLDAARAPDNLMKRTIQTSEILSGLSLFDDQRTLVHESSFLRESTSNNIPEPGTMALAGLALIGLAGSRKKASH